MKKLTPLSRETQAYQLFFLVAAIAAMLAPLLLLSMRNGYLPNPLWLSPGLWHAQEMIFGYSFAVIAGYLITRISIPKLAGLILLWLAGRLVWFIDIGLPKELAFLIAGLFPLILGAVTSQKFRAAKRLRNRMFTFVLLALAILSSTFYWLAYTAKLSGAYTSLYITLYLISLLIITMGGRLIPPATIGALRERGQDVRIPFQPTYETLCMLLVMILMLMELLPITKTWSAIPALGLAVILMIRLSAWRSVGIRSVMSVIPLHLGYFWMAAGFGLLACARLGFLLSTQDALHIITLGGIGTITLTMLIRVTGIRSKRPVPGRGLLLTIHSTLLGALSSRLIAHHAGPYVEHLLWCSALLWAITFLLFVVHSYILPAIRGNKLS